MKTALSDHVLILTSPAPEDPGEYVLVVYTHPSPFGAGATFFLVDRLETQENNLYYRGFLKEGDGERLVTQFPASQEYILFTRRKVKIIDRDEYETEQEKHEKEYERKSIEREENLGVVAAGKNTYL